MSAETEARERYRAAKAWGQEQARELDQARRDLKAAHDEVAGAKEAGLAAVAESEALAARLAAAEANAAEAHSAAVAAERRAKKNAEDAASLAAIKSALHSTVKADSDWDDDAGSVEERARRFDLVRAALLSPSTKTTKGGA